MRIGYFLSSEEHPPQVLAEQARLAEQAGFQALWISDHYHPWNDEQGQAPFVWSVIGAVSQVCRLPVTTAVTCPTMRMHPAIVAQAAATCALLLHGRFMLGVGSGEALNEHILGDRWPPTPERLEMLHEALDVMRALWTGRSLTHRGRHYTVTNARLYTRPEQPPPVYVSAFGPKAARLAAEIGDGLMSTVTDSSLVQAFQDAGGRGKPVQGAFKVCYGADETATRRLAHRLWATEALPGDLAQVLPLPRHFEQAGTLIDEEKVASQVLCGPDVDRHVRRIQEFADAGYTEVYVQQVGPTTAEFFRVYAEQVLPRFR